MFWLIAETLFSWRFEDGRKRRGRLQTRTKRINANRTPKHLQIVVWFVVGFFSGIIATIAIPRLCLQSNGYGWLTLLGSSLVAGLATHHFGSWRQRRGKRPLALGTFTAGAALILGTSLARMALGGIAR